MAPKVRNSQKQLHEFMAIQARLVRARADSNEAEAVPSWPSSFSMESISTADFLRKSQNSVDFRLWMFGIRNIGDSPRCMAFSFVGPRHELAPKLKIECDKGLSLQDALCLRITNSTRFIEIRSFFSKKVKDEFVLDGNDIKLVSRLAALINQRTVIFPPEAGYGQKGTSEIP
ncbi:60S ribosomal protein L9, partial [Fagus crenata]